MQSHIFSMSEDSLSLIINSLIDLKRLGGSANDKELLSFANACIVPERLPYSLLFKPESDLTVTTRIAYHVLKPMLQTARTVLERLKGVKDALHLLTRSRERRLETLERELTPSFLHGGVQSLPYDILSYVFQLVVEDDDGNSELLPELALSQVCRSFGSLAKDTPVLWSRLTSRMTKSCRYRHLEWSCFAHLTIVVCERKLSEDLGHFIQFLPPHASRWRAFRFRFEELIDSAPDTGTPVELARHLRGLHLQATIFASATSVFPLAFVRTFDFTWSIGSFDRQDWLNLLLSMKNLIELRLDIKNRQFGPFSWMPSDNDVLPYLENLDVRTRCPTSFSILMQNIQIPSLKKLRITIDGSQSQRPPEVWFERIPSKKFYFVTELYLSFSTSDQCSLDISILLEKFPGLMHLELQGSYDALRLGSIRMDLPPLRSMLMQLGTRNDQVFIRRFIKALKVSGRWENFDLFRFKIDNFLAKDQAEQLLTRNKVEWYE